MSDVITLTGVVATPPNTVTTGGGLAITHFRLASNTRRFDRATQKWVDGDSNFYSISAFRQTAYNVQASLAQGDRIVVTGRLRLKDWASGDRTGVTAEVDADAIGHDLTWGSSHFSKVRRSGTYQDDASGSGFPTSAELESSNGATGDPHTGQPTSGVQSDGVLNDGVLNDEGEGDENQGDRNQADDEDLSDDEVENTLRREGEVDVERASTGRMHLPAPF